jgi:hypothetical protein
MKNCNKEVEEDAIIENVEITCYDLLLQQRCEHWVYMQL